MFLQNYIAFYIYVFSLFSNLVIAGKRYTKYSSLKFFSLMINNFFQLQMQTQVTNCIVYETQFL